MSFHIITKDGRSETWYGNKKPKFPSVDFRESIVVFFQADGDELNFIINRIKNIPYTHSICTWRGSMAQFIYDNL